MKANSVKWGSVLFLAGIMTGWALGYGWPRLQAERAHRRAVECVRRDDAPPDAPGKIPAAKTVRFVECDPPDRADAGGKAARPAQF